MLASGVRLARVAVTCRGVSSALPDVPPPPAAALVRQRAKRERLISNPRLRIGAALLGLGLLFVALILLAVTLAAIASSNNAPSPFVEGGFLCCGHPDTWGEVGLGVVAGAAFAAGAAACVLTAVLLIVNRRIRMVRFAAAPAVAAALAVISIVIPVAQDRENARTAPECNGFVIDRRVFRQRAPSRAHERMVLGVAECGQLIGKSRLQVHALLGPPAGDPARFDYDRTRDSSSIWYGPLQVSLERGRVAEVSILPPSSGFD